MLSGTDEINSEFMVPHKQSFNANPGMQESRNDDLEAIIDELSRVFSQRAQAISLVRSIGFPSSDIPEFQTARIFWTEVIHAIHLGKIANGVPLVVNAAARLYPANTIFSNAKSSEDEHSNTTTAQPPPQKRTRIRQYGLAIGLAGLTTTSAIIICSQPSAPIAARSEPSPSPTEDDIRAATGSSHKQSTSEDTYSKETSPIAMITSELDPNNTSPLPGTVDSTKRTKQKSQTPTPSPATPIHDTRRWTTISIIEESDAFVGRRLKLSGPPVRQNTILTLATKCESPLKSMAGPRCRVLENHTGLYCQLTRNSSIPIGSILCIHPRGTEPAPEKTIH